MSNQIFGNVKNIPTQTLPHSATEEEVSVDIPSLVNRKTKAATLKSYLSEAGGFSMHLWNRPKIGRLPSGEMFLYDGDHRRHLYKLTHPDATKLPAVVVDVSSKEEIHKLFVLENKKNRKTLSANEVFVHEVRSGAADSLATEGHLKRCGLTVSLGTGEAGSVVGASSGYLGQHQKPMEVTINGFKKAVVDTNLNSVITAAQRLQIMWQNDHKIQAEFLGGLARVYKNIHDLNINKTLKSPFINFLNDRKTGLKGMNEVAAYFKSKGGTKVNYIEDCIALGIMDSFKEDLKYTKALSPKTWKKYFGVYRNQLKDKLDRV